MGPERRRLADLISVGPAMVRDFELLGVRSVAQLARRTPERLYRELQRRAGQHLDICVLDTFRAAVAQARDPRLPAEKCQWWWWSAQRKAGRAHPGKDGKQHPGKPGLQRKSPPEAWPCAPPQARGFTGSVVPKGAQNARG